MKQIVWFSWRRLVIAAGIAVLLAAVGIVRWQLTRTGTPPGASARTPEGSGGGSVESPWEERRTQQEPEEEEDLSPEQAGYVVDAAWQERVGALGWADALAVDAVGNLYVQKSGANRILKIGPEGQRLEQWDYGGHPGMGSDFSTGIAVAPAGERVYAITASGGIQVFTAGGRLLDAWDAPVSKGMCGIAVDDGFVYVAGQSARFWGVLQFTTDGKLYQLWSESYRGSYVCGEVAVDRNRHVYLLGPTSSGLSHVQICTDDGDVRTEWDVERAGERGASGCRGIAVDAQRNVYVGDSADRIWKLTADGKFLAKWDVASDWAGDFGVYGVGVDEAGNVYAGGPSGCIKFRPLVP